jgi:hypothetical protein
MTSKMTVTALEDPSAIVVLSADRRRDPSPKVLTRSAFGAARPGSDSGRVGPRRWCTASSVREEPVVLGWVDARISDKSTHRDDEDSRHVATPWSCCLT